MKFLLVCLIVLLTSQSSFGKRRAQGADSGGRNRQVRRIELSDTTPDNLAINKNLDTKTLVDANVEPLKIENVNKSNQDNQENGNDSVIAKIYKVAADAGPTKSVKTVLPSLERTPHPQAEKAPLKNRVVRYLRRDRDSRSRFE